MRLLFLLTALVLAGAPARAQADPDTTVYEVVDRPPELIGGMASLRPAYPEAERRAGIEGRVFVQFVVDPEGRPTRLRVVDAVSPGLDSAAVAAVRRARFRPGVLGGRPVRVLIGAPITFRLAEPGALYTRTAASIRAAGDAGARVTGRIPRGTRVAVVGCRAGWCLLQGAGPSGYVAESDLTPTAPQGR